ncbi:putative cobalt transporter CbtA [Spirosoma lacussanchae]|uniref:hypothetical protein n=1 Tax=Spirosoma lacussanchae TaxID=1884249 RepID=UPI00110887F8|nr:hypothetical protein [Spirosoma lacussanchae]
MIQRLLKPVLYFTWLAFAVAFLVLLASAVASAQTYTNLTPDCCLQAKDLQRQNQSLTARLQRAQMAYDTLSRSSNQVLIQIDERVTELTRTAGEQVRTQTALREQAERDRAAMKADNDTWVPRTRFGRFYRGRVMPVLAGVGAAALVVTGLVIAN